MLNKIGSLHTVPTPSAAVLNEALKLLTTFGDKKTIGSLVEQARDVQTHNEQVFKDAQALMAELASERKSLDDLSLAFAIGKVKEENSINSRSAALSQAEARLSGDKDRFTREQKEARLELSAKETDLENKESTITDRAEKTQGILKDLTLRALTLDKKETVLNDKERQLQAKENKLRALLDAG